MLVFGQIIFAQQSDVYTENWHAWRGPLYNGVSPEGNPPVEWSETKNIKWKTPIIGLGHSTPIIWGNTVFITTAVEAENFSVTAPSYRFVVMAINRENGQIRWEKTVKEETVTERIHADASLASNSSVTDGEHLYAYFGSRGLFCLDFNGNILWERDFGHMQKRSDFGEGDSPALYSDKIVILWDHEQQSVIYCIDKNTGEIIWQTNRDEPSSWSTPLIINYDGKIQVITSASNKVRSYDLNNGEVIWETAGLTQNVIPNPVFNNGILYVMSGYRGNALMAIRIAGAKGDITGSDKIIWTSISNTPYAPSPVLNNNILYFLRQNNGVLTALNAEDGTAYYEGEALIGLGVVYSSPVAAKDRLYVSGKTGTTVVVKQGPTPAIISENSLNDVFSASSAIAGNEIFLRGQNYLYCISEE